MKKIYLIRHCQAEGQEPTARLTPEGQQQAQELARLLEHKGIDFVVTSPFKRAIETIMPLCEKLNLNYIIDKRLQERVLSSFNAADWMDKLQDSYLNLELKYEGGESSSEAMDRGMEVIHKLINGPYTNPVVVTHGNLLSLILKYFDRHIGFEEWKFLSNPDVYMVNIEETKRTINRIWNEV